MSSTNYTVRFAIQLATCNLTQSCVRALLSSNNINLAGSFIGKTMPVITPAVVSGYSDVCKIACVAAVPNSM